MSPCSKERAPSTTSATYANYGGESPGDQFGYAIALSGNGKYLVAGAPHNRALGEERGRVIVLTAAEPTA
jgi:hypothetical protein